MSVDIECSGTRLAAEPLSASSDDFMGGGEGNPSESMAPDLMTILREKADKRARAHRPCLHALAGRVASRECTRDYRCDTCEFDQLVEKSNLVYPRIDNSFVDVEGYRLSEHCHYHPGHTWAHTEYGGCVRIGLDDFASSLIGYADGVQMPPPGARIFPGRPAFALKRDRHWVSVLSPIQGTILAVNSRVEQNPELIRTNAFEDGWLAVAKPDAVSNHCSSLVHGTAAREWLEQECGFLRVLLSGGLGGRLDAGNSRAPDRRTLISEWAWITLVETFLHTKVLLEPDRLIL